MCKTAKCCCRLRSTNTTAQMHISPGQLQCLNQKRTVCQWSERTTHSRALCCNHCCLHLGCVHTAHPSCPVSTASRQIRYLDTAVTRTKRYYFCTHSPVPRMNIWKSLSQKETTFLLYIQYILESNPHPFYSFGGLKKSGAY
jgi:hypothetical protein